MFIARELRPTTVFATQESYSKPTQLSGRKLVPLELAGTRMLTDSDKGTDNPDFAYDKAQRRIFGIFIHFMFIHHLECHTKREKTILQCGQSKIKGCENAHWAMTPTMSDDMMAKVLTKIDNKEELSPKKVGYVQSRLNLSSPTKNEFLDLSSVDKREFVIKHLEPKDYHNSFNRTHYELQLSGTLEGSIAANDFDQAIEKDIRPLEDASCTKISAKESTPTEELPAIFDDIYAIMKLSIANLQTRVTQLKMFYKLEAELDSFENNYFLKNDASDFENYAKNIKNFLDQKEALCKKMKYCANFDGAARFKEITTRRDFIWLKGFVATLSKCSEYADRFLAFEQHISRIKKDPLFTQFPALEKTEAMLAEAQSQLAGMTDIGKCNLSNLSLFLFGILEGGSRRSPTQDEILTQLIGMTRKEPKKSRKRTTRDEPENVAPNGKFNSEAEPSTKEVKHLKKRVAKREDKNPALKKKRKIENSLK